MNASVNTALAAAGVGTAMCAVSAATYLGYRHLQSGDASREPRQISPGAISDAELKEEIERMLEDLDREVRALDAFNAFASGGIPPRCDPMVLVIGNHSSGKSTFINQLCDGKIQEVGTAPTDDSFTVIQNGPVDLNEDGYTAVAKCDNTSKGFEGLGQFGHACVQHFKLKVRNLGAHANLPPGVVVVDSPGTIDTPTPDVGREYDFTRAVRWFVRRSAVVLLFFDPANPGTTGETLEVLKEALADSAHKFLIVLNKVDTLDNVLDFARAYGTLTWNLSKVLQKKDIPRIYTTFSETASGQAKDSGLPMHEFRRAREQVLDEIKLAPERHYDNAVMALEEIAKRLRMTYLVCRQTSYYPPNLAAKAFAAASGTLYSAALWLGLFPRKVNAVLGSIFFSSLCMACMEATMGQRQSPAGLDWGFARSHQDAVRNRADVDTRARWACVRDVLLEMESESHSAERLVGWYRARSGAALKKLTEILSRQLPRLRSLVDERRRRLAAQKC
eukprot:TRINITY_DN8938_c0_g1_i1.p1 TRINITY_DN8938_c0_g1~~TRINITY_DN8938_c0_g1_i1.p1  ORF type:complete len:504 (+),score=169.65 TRINITY_DN8938_c0_g1_i1:65-1576(+)